jgi:hypothetical protein
MSQRVEERLPRFVQVILGVVALGAWVPLVVFLIEATSIQLHWWTAPWGAGQDHALLAVAAGLAAAYTALFTLLAVFYWKRSSSGRRLVNSLQAVLPAAVGFWCSSALLGSLSVVPLHLVIAAFIALQVGVIVVEFRRVRRRST